MWGLPFSRFKLLLLSLIGHPESKACLPLQYHIVFGKVWAHKRRRIHTRVLSPSLFISLLLPFGRTNPLSTLKTYKIDAK
ncbi:hypothetical protein BDN72DRAFT_847390 [Pluteus cervinus]|uniref:Uncharacterized protein n=1 Tax=Pluteus cervinus TaxID=181527 RepID=A0ACD3ADQ0_9AGAR|nr:hypothetical protein BDN72DRAFT_847390 [Pluteus cervinus]